MSADEGLINGGVLDSYIGPDGHDEDMGLGQGVLDGRPAANLGVSVVVAENLEDVVAEILCDLGAGGDSAVGGRRDINALSVLDEELLHASGLELGDNAGSG